MAVTEVKLSEKNLRAMYCNKRMSTGKIAEVFNCNPETIRRKLIKNDIRRRLYEKKYVFNSNELEDLYLQKKISTLELAKRYGCSQWTIRSNLIKSGIKLRKPTDFLKWKGPGNKIMPDLNNLKNLSYILGVLFGDAWVQRYKNSYYVGLDVLDRPFADSFRFALKIAGLNPNLFQWRHKYWRTIASSKNFYLWFSNLSFKDIKNITFKYPIAFLRGIYESEGCLSRNLDKRCGKSYFVLIIVSAEERTILLTKSLMEKLGFHPRLNLRKPKFPRKPIWVLNLGKQEEVASFLNKIRPVIKTRPRKDL